MKSLRREPQQDPPRGKVGIMGSGLKRGDMFDFRPATSAGPLALVAKVVRVPGQAVGDTYDFPEEIEHVPAA